MAKSALLIVDLQNCFCPPNGELAVQDGDKIVNLVNQVIEFAKSRMWKIFASRDWHKKNSRHFSVNGGMWPVHGVENTRGSSFHPDLILPEDAIIISKGMEIWEDAYSAFDGFAFLKIATEQVEYYVKMKLNNILKDAEVDTIYVCGLATDYCVKATVLSALALGYKVVVLLDACKGVELHDGDIAGAISEMNRAGAEFSSVAELIGNKR